MLLPELAAMACFSCAAGWRKKDSSWPAHSLGQNGVHLFCSVMLAEHDECLAGASEALPIVSHRLDIIREGCRMLIISASALASFANTSGSSFASDRNAAN